MTSLHYYIIFGLFCAFVLYSLIRKFKTPPDKPSIKELMKEGAFETGFSLEEAERQLAEQNKTKDYIVAAQFDGTKGVSIDLVMGVVSELNKMGIHAQFEHAPGASGLESGGFLMNIKVPPTQIGAAKTALESIDHGTKS